MVSIPITKYTTHKKKKNEKKKTNQMINVANQREHTNTKAFTVHKRQTR